MTEDAKVPRLAKSRDQRAHVADHAGNGAGPANESTEGSLKHHHLQQLRRRSSRKDQLTARRRKSSRASSSVREESLEQRILPGFSKVLPNYATDASLWDKSHEDEIEFDKVDACHPSYCSADALKDILGSFIQVHHRVLELGCGLTPLSPLIKTSVGAHHVLCTDASAFAIHILGQKFGKLNPPVHFARLDVRVLKESLAALPAPDGFEDHAPPFDAIVSKGLVDCICTMGQSVHELKRFFRRVRAILRTGGTYLFVTNVSSRLRTDHLDLSQWTFESHSIETSEQHVHAVVCTAI